MRDNTRFAELVLITIVVFFIAFRTMPAQASDSDGRQLERIARALEHIAERADRCK